MNIRIVSLFAMLMASALSIVAKTTKYELKVNNFTELKVVDDIDVIYRCNPDSAGLAVFEAAAEQASGILFQATGTKLHIELSPDAPRQGLPVITVYSTYLNKVENAGKGRLTVYSPAPGAKLKARLIGNGRMTVTGIENQALEASIDTGNGTLVVKGKCEVAKLSNTGSGQLQADELTARQVKCSVWGTGSIGCSASETLSVLGAGSGQVYYLGSPSIKNRSIGVKTLPLNQ